MGSASDTRVIKHDRNADRLTCPHVAIYSPGNPILGAQATSLTQSLCAFKVVSISGLPFRSLQTFVGGLIRCHRFTRDFARDWGARNGKCQQGGLTCSSRSSRRHHNPHSRTSSDTPPLQTQLRLVVAAVGPVAAAVVVVVEDPR